MTHPTEGIARTVIHRGDLEVEFLESSTAVKVPMERLRSDGLVEVLVGRASLLPALGTPIELEKDKAYIVTAQFRGHLDAMGGCRALVAKASEVER